MQQENTNFETATMLKKDAVLTIKVGTGFVNRVYKLINYLYSDIPDDEKLAFEKEMMEAAEKQDFEKVYDKEWKNSIITTAMLLGSLQIAALDQKQTYDQKIDVNNQDSVMDVFKGLI